MAEEQTAPDRRVVRRAAPVSVVLVTAAGAFGAGLLMGWLLFGGDDSGPVPTAPSTSVASNDATTATLPPTTLASPTTTATTTTTVVPAPSTTQPAPPPPTLTLGQFLEQLEEQRDPDPPANSRIMCDEDPNTPVGRGTVLYCQAVPENPDAFETGTLVLVLLDDAGEVVYTGGTDVFDIHELAGPGLFCRDLRTHPYLSGLKPEVQYLFMLAYWFQDGQPDSMDADRDGIPCETLFEPEVVDTVWAGGQLT